MSFVFRRALVAGGGAFAAAVVSPTVLSFTGSDRGKSEEEKVIAPIQCQDGTSVMPWSAPPREQQVTRMREEVFDVLVIGGGCVGSGCALDAQTRGLKTAMVERSDFAAGTSGRSTKLIHGGIRYLEAAFKKLDWGSYRLVQEALDERSFMLQSAPYMAKPLPIMIPLYAVWQVPYFWAGAKVYDLVAGSRRQLPASHYISKAEALYQFPMLKQEGLQGAIVYYDGQMNDTRMSLAVALTAAQSGAAVANRIAVTDLVKDANGTVAGARVRDETTGEEWTIRARCVINATGASVGAGRC